MLDSFLSRGLNVEQAASELLVVLYFLHNILYPSQLTPYRFSAVGATSYTMQGIILGIITNTATYDRLQREIDTTVQKRSIPASDCAPDTVLKGMTYLQACISEGIRMHPAITQLRERVVPPEGDSLHGHHLPGGTYVALNGLSSQFDPTYGEDLEVFRPERWLIDDSVQIGRMQRNLELNFGYGSSKCLGVNLARIELDKVVFEVSRGARCDSNGSRLTLIVLKLFRNYDVVVANVECPWSYRGDFVLADFHVVLTKRYAHV